MTVRVEQLLIIILTKLVRLFILALNLQIAFQNNNNNNSFYEGTEETFSNYANSNIFQVITKYFSLLEANILLDSL